NIVVWDPTVRFIDAWIYAFHMPLFFFLSGLFLLRSTDKRWGEFATDKIRVLAYPYFVWSVITIIVKSGLGSAVHQPYELSDLSRILYAPVDQFWFLYVLFVLLIILSTSLRFGIRPWVILLLTVLVYPGILPTFAQEPAVAVELRFMAIYVAIGLLVADF